MPVVSMVANSETVSVFVPDSDQDQLEVVHRLWIDEYLVSVGDFEQSYLACSVFHCFAPVSPRLNSTK